jgi:hypothetical protein
MTDTAHARFDAGLRAHHAAAVTHVSPATRAQLAQRRRAALQGERPRAAHGMRYALGGFAAVAALVVGLQLRQPMLPVTAPASQPAIAAQGTVRPDTLLDEDAEFYAWLASNDARLVAME